MNILEELTKLKKTSVHTLLGNDPVRIAPRLKFISNLLRNSINKQLNLANSINLNMSKPKSRFPRIIHSRLSEKRQLNQARKNCIKFIQAFGIPYRPPEKFSLYRPLLSRAKTLRALTMWAPFTIRPNFLCYVRHFNHTLYQLELNPETRTQKLLVPIFGKSVKKLHFSANNCKHQWLLLCKNTLQLVKFNSFPWSNEGFLSKIAQCLSLSHSIREVIITMVPFFTLEYMNHAPLTNFVNKISQKIQLYLKLTDFSAEEVYNISSFAKEITLKNRLLVKERSLDLLNSIAKDPSSIEKFSCLKNLFVVAPKESSELKLFRHLEKLHTLRYFIFRARACDHVRWSIVDFCENLILPKNLVFLDLWVSGADLVKMDLANSCSAALNDLTKMARLLGLLDELCVLGQFLRQFEEITDLQELMLFFKPKMDEHSSVYLFLVYGMIQRLRKLRLFNLDIKSYEPLNVNFFLKLLPCPEELHELVIDGTNLSFLKMKDMISLPNLHTLQLLSDNEYNPSEQGTDGILGLLRIANSPRLRDLSLNLSHEKGFNEKIIYYLQDPKVFPNLEVLVIYSISCSANDLINFLLSLVNKPLLKELELNFPQASVEGNTVPRVCSIIQANKKIMRCEMRIGPYQINRKDSIEVRVLL